MFTEVLSISRVITDKSETEFKVVATGTESLDPSLLDKTDGRLLSHYNTSFPLRLVLEMHLVF